MRLRSIKNHHMKNILRQLIGLAIIAAAVTAGAQTNVPLAFTYTTNDNVTCYWPMSLTGGKLIPTFLPIPSLTPGDVDTNVTAAMVSVKGYANGSAATGQKGVRNVPQSLKNQVYRAYGIDPKKHDSFEIDHLLSIELGGKNTFQNLWPESYHGLFNAHEKDKLENFLHAQVAAGKMTLVEAQQRISTYWVATYREFGMDKAAPVAPSMDN